MKKAELVKYLNENIKINAYRATICERIRDMGFDEAMMEYRRQIGYGKAFAFIETLHAVTDTNDESAYEEAVDEAINDIKIANYDIVKMLDMAGFNGKEYYETTNLAMMGGDKND